MLQVDLILTDYLFGIFRTLYDLTDFASKSRSRYPPKLYSIPFHQNYSISPPTPVTENVSISEWYMYRPKVSGGFFGGGGLLESSRILELPVHLFTSTLFRDFSEINWFAATFFHIHNVDYLVKYKRHLRNWFTTRNICDNQTLVKLAKITSTQIKVGLQICCDMSLFPFVFWRCQINQRGRESIAQKNRPKSNQCWHQSKSTTVLVYCQFKKNWGKITCKI